MVRRLLLAAIAVPALSALTACGGSSSSASSASTSGSTGSSATSASASGSVSTTTAPSTPEQLAVAAYRHGWDVFFQALNPPNPLSPSIIEAFTGTALQDTVRIVSDVKSKGEYVHGTIALQPKVVDVTASSVTLTDCTVESSTNFDVATGDPKEAGPYPPENRMVTVTLESGKWKVATIKPVETPCTPA